MLYLGAFLVINSHLSPLRQKLVPFLLALLLIHPYELVPLLRLVLPVHNIGPVLRPDIIQVALVDLDFLPLFQVVLVPTISDLLLLVHPPIEILSIVLQKLLVIMLF